MQITPLEPVAPALALALLAGVAACAGDVTLPQPGDEIIVAWDQDVSGFPADAWTLETATVTDGALDLTVAYPGGCRAHDLWLLAVDDVREPPAAGPLPTLAAPLRLAHEANNDPCEALITRSFAFDLQPLRAAFVQRYGTGGRILLRLPTGQGSQDSVTLDLPVP